MGDHLRLLAGQLAPASVQDIWPAPLCPAPHGVPSLPAQALTEACRVPQ
jgi:hypothetical protein